MSYMQASTSWPVVRIRRLRFGCTTRGCPHTSGWVTREWWRTWRWARTVSSWWARARTAAYSCGVFHMPRTPHRPVAGVAQKAVAVARAVCGNSRPTVRGSCRWRRRCRPERRTLTSYLRCKRYGRPRIVTADRLRRRRRQCQVTGTPPKRLSTDR